MLAKFDGLDYHIFLSERTGEVNASKISPLEAPLMNFQETEDLGRRVIFQTGENKNPEGAELTLDPSGTVVITLSPLAYHYFETTKVIYTTYLGSENKLRIQIRPF